MATEEITTHDIKVGDLILNHGMRLRVDQEPQPTRHLVDSAAGVTLATAARIENWDEVVEEAKTGDHCASAFIVGQARQDDEGVARWVIQGNGWATWTRES